VDNQVRARVFVSCGQQRDTVEEKIADEILAKITRDYNCTKNIASISERCSGVIK
jgi:hypothetical protein